ncbi:MAG: hypothetical protein IPH07_23535 [Deltaproteobacteria bacterium]|nr:hypothetical protein [Deltaproteobacteria bacterium]MBK8720620.1 hypothetical protein [Deltaproteobacteria bacterium]
MDKGALMQRHLFVPDTQIRKGVDIAHLDWLTYFALDKGPTKVIFAGDWWDLPSLSTFNPRGSLSTEGARLRHDIEAPRRCIERVVGRWYEAGWLPEIHFCMGNHENRFRRAVEAAPHLLDGYPDPFQCLRDLDIKVHPFLEIVKLDGVAYSHFFPHNAQGKVMQNKNGAPSARAQCQRLLSSTTAGHQQGLDVAVIPTPSGLTRGLIAGSFYLHDEEYIGPLNHYWRGMIMKNNVRRGDYTLCEVDMAYLERKYGRLSPRGRRAA